MLVWSNSCCVAGLTSLALVILYEYPNPAVIACCVAITLPPLHPPRLIKGTSRFFNPKEPKIGALHCNAHRLARLFRGKWGLDGSVRGLENLDPAFCDSTSGAYICIEQRPAGLASSSFVVSMFKCYLSFQANGGNATLLRLDPICDCLCDVYQTILLFVRPVLNTSFVYLSPAEPSSLPGAACSKGAIATPGPCSTCRTSRSSTSTTPAAGLAGSIAELPASSITRSSSVSCAPAATSSPPHQAWLPGNIVRW